MKHLLEIELPEQRGDPLSQLVRHGIKAKICTLGRISGVLSQPVKNCQRTSEAAPVTDQ